MAKITQLRSVYLLKDGEHHIEYTVQVESPFYFSDISVLWEDAISGSVNLSNGNRTAKWIKKESKRAEKFSKSELDFIFGDLVNSYPKKVETPNHLKVTGYARK